MESTDRLSMLWLGWGVCTNFNCFIYIYIYILASKHKGRVGFDISICNYCISVHKVYLFLCLFLIYLKCFFIAIFLVLGNNMGV